MNNVELNFKENIHSFEKASKRVNRTGEQKYVCSSCGLVGYLKKDSETILIKKGNKDAIENCSKAGAGNVTQATMINPDIGKWVKLKKDIPIGGTDITIDAGSILQVIECPKSHKKDHNMKAWIKYGERVMFLYDSEREFVDAPNGVEKVPEEREQKESEKEVLVEVEEEVTQPEEYVATDAGLIPETEFEKIVEKSDKQVDEHIEVMTEQQEQIHKDSMVLADELSDSERKKYKKTGVVSVGADEFKNGKYHLEDEDKIKYGLDMAAAEHEITNLTKDLKAEKKKFKDLIDIQKEIVDDLGKAIRNGFEEKPILCEKFFDYDQGKILWRSKQNGNVVKIEDMKPQDYQMDFTYEKEEENKEEE